MLIEKINNGLKESMKSKDKVALATYRSIKTKVNELIKELGEENVTDSNIIEGLIKLAKQRNQSIELYNQGGRDDLVELETQQLNIIESLLPEKLSEEKVMKLVDIHIEQSGLAGLKDMGRIMSKFHSEYAGQFDPKMVSNYARVKLTTVS